ncbi:hypothetical protein GGR56DRAFT_405870 [Xylariaceae sp. FL0804]|nr:hypothetical protein GGR56DRAFT_405870 [Xylariaceae sp. FL0804]
MFFLRCPNTCIAQRDTPLTLGGDFRTWRHRGLSSRASSSRRQRIWTCLRKKLAAARCGGHSGRLFFSPLSDPGGGDAQEAVTPRSRPDQGAQRPRAMVYLRGPAAADVCVPSACPSESLGNRYRADPSDIAIAIANEPKKDNKQEGEKTKIIRRPASDPRTQCVPSPLVLDTGVDRGLLGYGDGNVLHLIEALPSVTSGKCHPILRFRLSARLQT